MRRVWLGCWLIGLFLLVIGGDRLLAQEPVSLLITEVSYDPPGRDDEEEWVEIANLGIEPILLHEYKIGDAAGVGSREGMLVFPEESTIDPGQVILVAQSAAGFQARFGFRPDFEIHDSDPSTPDMQPYRLWGTGEFALNNDGDDVLLLDPQNRPVDFVNYGDVDHSFYPAVNDIVNGQTIARQPAGCDTDSAGDWIPLSTPTPGTITLAGECRPRPEPENSGDILPIGSVQGETDISPYINQIVTVRGIVTGFLADQNAAGVTFHTLFIQDEGDDDPLTSDGIAVFLATLPPSYSMGDELLVTGRVTEFFGLTEIDHEDLQIARLSGKNLLPQPVSISETGRLEHLEGMRVSLPELPVVGPTHIGCGFAVAISDQEHFETPLLLFRRSANDLLPGLIQVLHTTDVDCSGIPQLKAGDRVAGLDGPLTFHFDEFKIVQQDPAGLAISPAPMPTLPIPPRLNNGQISIATYNLENHFDQVRTAGEPVVPAAQVMAREEHFARIIHETLDCPSILGVQEVENAALLRSLAERLAVTCGFEYEVTHAESLDERGIDVALLTDPGRVAVQSFALQQACTSLTTDVNDPNSACPAGEFPLFARPPLMVNLFVDEFLYTVFVNHFKSKREGEAETAAWRLAQAVYQNELVQTMLENDPMARIMVMGDFNDFEQSPPLLALTRPEGALINPLLQIPDEERYTYNFGGAAQLIDGILLSPAVSAQVAAVTIAHVNADFPAGWAQENPDSLFRSADHDIPLLVLDRPVILATETPAPQPTDRPSETATSEPAGTQLPSATDTVAEQNPAPEPPTGGSLWFIGLGVLIGAGLVLGILYVKGRR